MVPLSKAIDWQGRLNRLRERRGETGPEFDRYYGGPYKPTPSGKPIRKGHGFDTETLAARPNIPGQSVAQWRREAAQADALVSGKREGYSVERAFDRPVLRVAGVFRGLPPDAIDEAHWSPLLSDLVATSRDEVTLRTAVAENMLHAGISPGVRRIVLERVLSLFRATTAKSMLLVLPTELLSLRKGEARGGTYHRRVPKPGGGYRYYYDPEQYEARTDAHDHGPDVQKKYIAGRVERAVDRAGAKGCSLQDFAGLCRKHGAETVRAVINDLPLEYRNGRLHRKDTQKSTAAKLRVVRGG